LIAVAVGAALAAFGAFERSPGPTVAFFGYRGDGSWNDNIAAGLDRAARQHDMVLVEASSIVDPSADFRELAEKGPDIIISDAQPVRDAPEVYMDFPDIEFGIIDGFLGAPNVTGVLFDNEQGAFLAGVAAAKTTETGVVGFVGGDQGAVGDFQAGFEAGVHWVDPDVEVLATYIVQQFVQETGGLPIFAFGRPDLGADRATALYERGADVVFHAAGESGQGIFPAAAESSTMLRKLWAIGVDNDQSFQVAEIERPHVLTSLIKRGDAAAERLVELLLRDEPADGVVRVGLADGVFRLSTQGGWLTDDTLATLERAESAIVEGRLVVPSRATGEVLDLDPVQNAFEDALSVLTRLEVDEYLHTWLEEHYPLDVAAGPCSSALAAGEAQCLDVITMHLQEYVDER
jgi:basic membrane protein A